MSETHFVDVALANKAGEKIYLFLDIIYTFSERRSLLVNSRSRVQLFSIRWCSSYGCEMQ